MTSPWKPSVGFFLVPSIRLKVNVINCLIHLIEKENLLCKISHWVVPCAHNIPCFFKSMYKQDNNQINNYWIIIFYFPLSKEYTHFSAQSTFLCFFIIMFWVNRNLNRKAWNYVIKVQVRLNKSPNMTLWAVLHSYIIPVRGIRQQPTKPIIINWCSGLLRGNLHGKASIYVIAKRD